jgi:hypothetical protein
MEIHSHLTGDVIRLNNHTGTRLPESAHFGKFLAILQKAILLLFVK